MKLRKRQTGLNLGYEGRPPSKSTLRFTSILYFLILAAIGLYIVHFVTARMITVEGRGQIELSKVFVGAGEEGVLQELLVDERDHVARGQAVAKLSMLPIQKKDALQRPSWIERDILDASKDIAGLRSRLSLLKDRLRRKRRLLQNEMEWENAERALELRLTQDTETARLAREVEDLQYDVAQLQEELKHETTFLKKLKRKENLAFSIPDLMTVHLTAPKEGTVIAVYKGLRDYLGKEEVLMAVVPSGASVHIRAVFDAEDLSHIKPGRPATLVLPDAKQVKAVIGDIYAPAARHKLLRMQELAETPRRIEAKILPKNGLDYSFWKHYNNMDIQVKVQREWFDFPL